VQVVADPAIPRQARELHGGPRAARAGYAGGVHDQVDLDAYLARIGHAGPVPPTLATLNALAAAHVQHIPFENLDVLLGRPIELDLAALQAKLVTARRGGYCFEHNTLFLAVLAQLGFEVRPLSARVRYQRPREFTPARTHLFIRVELGDSWLVDVGVGAMSATAALRLADDGPQATPHEPRRIVREGALLYDQVQLGGAWQDVKEFTLEEMPPIDRVVANWYTSAHPSSHFKNRLLVARATADGGRIGLLDRELSVRGRDGVATRTTITDHPMLERVLATQFGITLPAGSHVRWSGPDGELPGPPPGAP